MRLILKLLAMRKEIKKKVDRESLNKSIKEKNKAIKNNKIVHKK